MRPRKFWRDEYDGKLSPGWALALVTMFVLAFGLLIQWINDMHMYHYGLFGSR